MDIRLALMTGVNIPIEKCQLIIHQPSVEEISYLGEEDFFIGVQTLCISKNMVIEDKNVLNQVSNFQVFMTVMNDKSTIDKRQKVESVLQLMGLGKAAFTPRSLILTDYNNNSHVIDESNFDALQDAIKLITCAKDGPMDQQAFNPADDRAREIAEKLMRGRARVAAQKGSSAGSAFSRYLSVLSIVLNTTPLSLQKMTMFQLYDLMERYALWVNWDLDIRTRLAGGKPDSHPDDWMKNIH